MLDQLYILPILLFSVVIHEVAHGWMALRLGDPTARDMGRLTLNPLPHIDPIGSVLIPLLSILGTGRLFIAWAKPVPVNPDNFLHRRRDDLVVSAVGPCSNVLLALICTLIFIGLLKIDGFFSDRDGIVRWSFDFCLRMFYGGIALNVMLAVFNMIPVPPLDGSHVLAALLPEELSNRYRRIGFFGVFALVLLMRWAPFSAFFDNLIKAVVSPFHQLILYAR